MSIDIEEMKGTLTPAARKAWDQIEEVLAEYIVENKSKLTLNQIAALRERKFLEVKCASLDASLSRTKDEAKIRKMKLERKELERAYAGLEKKVGKFEPGLDQKIAQLRTQNKKNSNAKKAG